MSDWDGSSDDMHDWQTRDPNAPQPGGGGYVPQTSNPTTSDPFGGNSPYISHENYQWAGQEGGADRDVEGLRYRNDVAQQRPGVGINNNLANVMQRGQLDARRQQQYLGSQYQQQLTGQGPSAAQVQGQMALEQALQAQAAASSSGPTAQGSQAMLAGNAQAAAARGAEVAAAARGYGSNASAMRTGDIRSMGLSQEQAYRAAQLDAAQRARNDAMARFYVGQEGDIRRQQLVANENYESQRDANYHAALDDSRRRAAHRADEEANVLADYGNSAIGLFTGGATHGGR